MTSPLNHEGKESPNARASGGSRTRNPRITNAVLCRLKLRWHTELITLCNCIILVKVRRFWRPAACHLGGPLGINDRSPRPVGLQIRDSICNDWRMETQAPDPGRRDVMMLVNPRAGWRSREQLVQDVADSLKDRDFQVHVVSEIDQLREQAAELWSAQRLRAVVAAGGDGTVSLTANLVAPDVPIVTLPLGTENLLAKYLKITADAQAVADVVQQGRQVRLDAGLAGDRMFLLMIGCGFDADVVRRLHAARTGHIQRLSYAKPILDSIRNYQYPELRIRFLRDDSADEAEYEEIRACWAFVANLPRYAANLSIFPDASGTDGLLDVCTFKEGSLWKGLWYLGGVLLGQHKNLDECVTCKTTKLRIESDADEVPYQLDGDPGGTLPVDIEILPQRLTLLVKPSDKDEQN